MPVMPALSLDVPVELIKDPRSWTEEEVSVWLRWLGIGEHAEAASHESSFVLGWWSSESVWIVFVSLGGASVVGCRYSCCC